MRRLTLVLVSMVATSGFAAAQEKTLYEKIDEAISKGVEYLKKTQKDDGSFGDVDSETLYGGGTGKGYAHQAGLTAFALYALLKCGVKPDDPYIRRGFAFIDSKDKIVPDRDFKYFTSYELSAMILALEAMHNPIKKESVRITLEKTKAALKNRRIEKPRPVVMPPKDVARMQDWIDHLTKRRSPKGWRYNLPGGMSGLEFEEDLSSTQFTMLAFRAASHCFGVKIENDAVFGAIEFILEQQDKDGPKYESPVDPFEENKPGKSVQVVSGMSRGFAYNRASSTRHEKISTGSMTTAGCASLIIAKSILLNHAQFRRDYEAKVNQAIQDSMVWIDLNWSMKGNPRCGSYFYYYLYGLERVGDLQGTLMIGKHYWYNEGAELLVADQLENGAWQRADTHFPQDVINTAFALLFLDRATPPVVTTR